MAFWHGKACGWIQGLRRRMRALAVVDKKPVIDFVAEAVVRRPKNWPKRI